MKSFFNVIQYLVVFLAFQVFSIMVVGIVWFLCQGETFSMAVKSFTDGRFMPDGQLMALDAVVSSLLTIAVFLIARWSPFSRDYVRTRPWTVLVWVAVLACGTLIPSAWLQEQLGVEMSEEAKRMFEQVMRQPVGYLAVGILAPIAEEMVFRGAILRELLPRFQRQWHWLPIVISAVLFGAVHGNWAQFVHATLLGLLLGWMYYRTNSIVPGIVLHWVNNTIAYVVYNLLPQASDSTLLELLGGSQRAVWMALLCSMCIFLPALFQVAVRMRKSHL